MTAARCIERTTLGVDDPQPDAVPTTLELRPATDPSPLGCRKTGKI
jgi:hypothetical protein